MLSRILRGIFHQPAQTFAKFTLEFDKAVDECGLVDASRLALGHYVRDVRVFGLDRVPDSAFLALSNHPGMTDTLSLFAALNRPALKVIALDRPFLLALPNMSKQLFFVKDEPASRMKLVRRGQRTFTQRRRSVDISRRRNRTRPKRLPWRSGFPANVDG